MLWCRARLAVFVFGTPPGKEIVMASPILEKSLEEASGQSIQSLRSMSVSEVRAIAKKKFGGKFHIKSRWPFIGRGTVMRNNVLTHEQVETAFDAALKKR
jgi:hypothetical protein